MTKNTLYPLKPNYTGKKSSWSGFPWHQEPIAYVEDIPYRAEEIVREKPESELPVRAEHFVVIPDELVPKYLKKAEEVEKRAWKAREKAREKTRKAREIWEKAREKAREEWEKTRKAQKEAREEWEKVRKKASRNPRIIKYLKEHTPYQWDGKTLIFPPSP